WRSITPGYLEALGIRLRRGRRPDRGDVRHAGPGNPPQPEIDVPQAQWPSRSAYLAILVDGDPAALTAAVRREIVALEPDAAIARERTMRRVIDEYISPERLMSSLLGAFAVVALLLAATGPYGVIAYVVSRRMREIGIRMAVGARTADVVALVLREGTVMVLAGAAVGLALAFAVARALESVLFGATSTDPLVFAGVSSGCWSRPRSPRASSRRCAPRDWTRCGRCAATRPRGAAAGSSRTLRIRDRSSSANSASRTAVSGAGGDGPRRSGSTARPPPARPPALPPTAFGDDLLDRQVVRQHQLAGVRHLTQLAGAVRRPDPERDPVRGIGVDVPAPGTAAGLAIELEFLRPSETPSFPSATFPHGERRAGGRTRPDDAHLPSTPPQRTRGPGTTRIPPASGPDAGLFPPCSLRAATVAAGRPAPSADVHQLDVEDQRLARERMVQVQRDRLLIHGRDGGQRVLPRRDLHGQHLADLRVHVRGEL